MNAFVLRFVVQKNYPMGKRETFTIEGNQWRTLGFDRKSTRMATKFLRSNEYPLCHEYALMGLQKHVALEEESDLELPQALINFLNLVGTPN